MPRYFFDLVNRDLIVEDRVGLDLKDDRAARERATALALSEVSQLKMSAEPYDLRELHVRAAAGQRVAKIAFRYVSA